MEEREKLIGTALVVLVVRHQSKRSVKPQQSGWILKLSRTVTVMFEKKKVGVGNCNIEKSV